MTTFRPVWSDEQRAAVIAAVLENQQPLATVLATARTEGIAGLEPFDMPYSTAYSVIGRAKKDRRSTGDMLRDLGHRVLRLTEQEIERLEGLDELSPQDLRNRRLVVRTLNDLERLFHGLGDDDPRGETPATPTQTGENLIARLVREEAMTEKVRAARATPDTPEPAIHA